MKYRWDKKYLYWGITIFLVLIATIGFYYFLFHQESIKGFINRIFQITSPILCGVILAYLFIPILNGIEKKIIIPFFAYTRRGKKMVNRRLVRNCSVTSTIFVILALLYGFFALIIPQIYMSISSIIGQYNTYVNNLINWIDQILSLNPDLDKLVQSAFVEYSDLFKNWVNSNILPQLENILKSLSNGVFGFLNGLLDLIIGFIISIYLMSSKETFVGQAKKIIYAIFSIDKANIIIDEVRFAHKTFIGFIGGKIVDSIIIGFLCFGGTTLLGIEYSLLISIIIGVTNMIPYFGPFIGAIPSTLLVLMIDPKLALYFVIFIIILQQFDGNILGPKILGEYTGISSFWVIFAITIFGGIFGIVGMFIGVPVFAIIYVMIKRVIARMLEQKGLTSKTTLYMNLKRIEQDHEYLYEAPEHGEKSTFFGHLFKIFKIN